MIYRIDVPLHRNHSWRLLDITRRLYMSRFTAAVPALVGVLAGVVGRSVDADASAAAAAAYSIFMPALEGEIGQFVCPQGFSLHLKSGGESTWMPGFTEPNDLPFCERTSAAPSHLCPSMKEFWSQYSTAYEWPTTGEYTRYHGCRASSGNADTCCVYPRPETCSEAAARCGNPALTDDGTPTGYCKEPWVCLTEYQEQALALADLPDCQYQTSPQLGECLGRCGRGVRMVKWAPAKGQPKYCRNQTLIENCDTETPCLGTLGDSAQCRYTKWSTWTRCAAAKGAKVPRGVRVRTREVQAGDRQECTALIHTESCDPRTGRAITKAKDLFVQKKDGLRVAASNEDDDDDEPSQVLSCPAPKSCNPGADAFTVTGVVVVLIIGVIIMVLACLVCADQYNWIPLREYHRVPGGSRNGGDVELTEEFDAPHGDTKSWSRPKMMEPLTDHQWRMQMERRRHRQSKE